MSDWQVGDLALLVKVGSIRCARCAHLGGNNPQEPRGLAVVAVGAAIIERGPNTGEPCGCVVLDLEDGSRGVSQRFRKIRPDEPQACEEEFQTLLKRSKVSA